MKRKSTTLFQYFEKRPKTNNEAQSEALVPETDPNPDPPSSPNMDSQATEDSPIDGSLDIARVQHGLTDSQKLKLIQSRIPPPHVDMPSRFYKDKSKKS